jgi:hypothetical protein
MTRIGRFWHRLRVLLGRAKPLRPADEVMCVFCDATTDTTPIIMRQNVGCCIACVDALTDTRHMVLGEFTYEKATLH